ncbi:MAG: hypothetical protein R2744_00805 [Bacteroidales bacterium]
MFLIITHLNRFKLANQYQEIRNIVKEHGIEKFYDAGKFATR